MNGFYWALDDNGEPRRVTLDEWVAWYQAAHAHQAVMQLGHTTLGGDVQVSTVFLALTAAAGRGRLALYETMIFGGPYDRHRWLYCTGAQAVSGHDEIVAALRNGTRPAPTST